MRAKDTLQNGMNYKSKTLMLIGPWTSVCERMSTLCLLSVQDFEGNFR